MKIKSIRRIHLDEPVPVYDIETPNHNFALANGTIVHNSRVDHSNYEGGSDYTKQSTGVNSKDISDALVRLVAKIYLDGKKALDVPLENTEYHADYMLSALKSIEKLQLERSIRSKYPQSTFNPYKVR